MAAELVNSATSDNLAEMDWAKNIQICELVARDQRAAKDAIKAIKRRLGGKSSSSQLYSLLLLETLINNTGENIHRQVVESGILPILVKIAKTDSDFSIRERIFHLLDAAQASLGGASGKFPQYYSAYHELVCVGIKFPQQQSVPLDLSSVQVNENGPSNPTLPGDKSDMAVQGLAFSRDNGLSQQLEEQCIPESSIIQKARTALEVLKEVLSTVDSQKTPHPLVAKDEFTLDLVEQCSFQKQRVMRLVVTSRDEKVVSQAIELNEQLQKVLERHDALLSGRTGLSAYHTAFEAEEEEEDQKLFRRRRKGKACGRREDEGSSTERLALGMSESSLSEQSSVRVNQTSAYTTQAENSISNGEAAFARGNGLPQQPEVKSSPESSIIQKARNALEVVREVLDNVDDQRTHLDAKDEFTLDLVEQCSFHKQRVMHLVLTSRNDKLVYQAIELNEQLQKVLEKHDALLSGRSGATANYVSCEPGVEEEAQHLVQRIRKGKACVAGDENSSMGRCTSDLSGPSNLEERQPNHPLKQPSRLEPSDSNGWHVPVTILPPPPAKHAEREKFFQENKAVGSAVSERMRFLSLHKGNGSGSHDGGKDCDN